MSVNKKVAVRWTAEQREVLAKETFKILDAWNELPLNPQSALRGAWLQAQKHLFPPELRRDEPSTKETSELKHVIGQMFAARCKQQMDDSRAAKLAAEALELSLQTPDTSKVSSLLDQLKRR